jgi:PPOX class probable F420-dependent enzyme
MADDGRLLDPVRRYLSTPRCAVLSSVASDGAPHQAVVHYLLEHHGLLINGRTDRRWSSNLRRDPRISLVVHDADQPLHWVGLKGTAELFREGRSAVDDAMAMARRYGEDLAAYEDQERVSFLVLPRHIYEYS